MNLLQRFRGSTYFLVVVCYLAYGVAEPNAAIGVLGVLAAVFSWVLVERTGRGMPRWLINVGVLFSSVLLFWELVLSPQQDPNLLQVLAHFMAAILGCKLFERKGGRDYSQILTLSLLIMVTAAIFSQSMFFGLLLAVYLAAGLYVVLLFHLRTELAAQPEGVDGAEQTPMDAGLRRDVRRVGWAAAAVLMGTATIAFLAFPRNKGRELFADLVPNRPQPVSGFSDRVSFGDFGRIQQSNVVVMEVTLKENGAAEGLPSDAVYFRGTTFDTYEYNTRVPQWKRSGRSQEDHSSAHELLDSDWVPLADEGLYGQNKNLWRTQHITLYASSGATLFAMAPAVAFSNTSGDLRAITQSQRDGTLNYTAGALAHLTYEVITPVDYKPEIMYQPIMGVGVPAVAGDIPEAVKAKARDVAGDLMPAGGGKPGPAQARKIADRIENYLRTHYAYSLDTRPVDGKLDPVSDFLVNRQKVGGHCEYFAAAMVLMCDALQVPARMVTGYHGGDFNSIDGVYTVRQKNAHAWVEALTGPEWANADDEKGGVSRLGWVSFDPTPGGDVTPSALESWTRWMGEMLQVLERGWMASVVSFDNNSRAYLAQAIIRPVEDFFGGVKSAGMGVAMWVERQWVSPKATAWSRVRISILGVVMVGVCWWGARRWQRRRSSEVRVAIRHLSRARRKSLAAELRFFDELMRLLRRRGWRRTAEQTPREFVAQVGQGVAAISDDALWVVDRFYELRFGGGRSSGALQGEIGERLSRMRSVLKHVR